MYELEHHYSTASRLMAPEEVRLEFYWPIESAGQHHGPLNERASKKAGRVAPLSGWAEKGTCDVVVKIPRDGRWSNEMICRRRAMRSNGSERQVAVVAPRWASFTVT
jgi:hypothetical protein